MNFLFIGLSQRPNIYFTVNSKDTHYYVKALEILKKKIETAAPLFNTASVNGTSNSYNYLIHSDISNCVHMVSMVVSASVKDCNFYKADREDS